MLIISPLGGWLSLHWLLGSIHCAIIQSCLQELVKSVGLSVPMLVAKTITDTPWLLISLALYIFPSPPLMATCQLLDLTCFPLILDLFLIVGRPQKHVAQLEGIVYKQIKQNCLWGPFLQIENLCHLCAHSGVFSACPLVLVTSFNRQSR